MIFETHAHYDDDRFNEDREEILQSLPEAGIGVVINSGASVESTRDTVELAKRYTHVYAAVGVHPSEIEELDEEFMDWMREQTAWEKTVAIGEIGLDYACDVDVELQKDIFRKQLEIAQELQKPVVLHCVRAFEDAIRIIGHYTLPAVIFHGFIGSKEQAQRAIGKGYYLSFGDRTWRSPKTIEALRNTPLERMFIETDDAATTIDKQYLEVTRIKQVSLKDLQMQILNNYNKLFLPNG